LTSLGVIALSVLIGLWAWRAFSDTNYWDFGLAYPAGRVTWDSGHPESVFTWESTPFLAGSMAITYKLWSESTASRLLTALNVTLVVVTITMVVRRLRGVLSPGWLWIVALGLASFSPVLSTVWWKQFNIIALVLALAGFAALRRDRAGLSGGLIGLSIAVKPLAVLLPFVLLGRRGTRVAGIWALVFVVGLNLGAQGLYAAHAHSLSAADPLNAVKNFVDKSSPKGLACSAINFSPQALLCRTVGSAHLTLLEVVAWTVVAALAVWSVKALHGYDTASWESFAFTCVFSTMVSSTDWSHYQVMLAPMFVLLVVRFATTKTEAPFWVGLTAAYVLASLMLTPYGTILDALGWHLSTTLHLNSHPFITNIAQYSQYVLLVTATIWYRRHGREAPKEDAPRTALAILEA
jgi:hypothetical protein